MSFEGHKNYETWMTYNIINSDPSIREEIFIIASETSMKFFKLAILTAIQEFYNVYPTKKEARLDVGQIDYLQLFQRLKREGYES
jgi:hypothetical protein